jgi:hypothetical protein
VAVVVADEKGDGSLSFSPIQVRSLAEEKDSRPLFRVSRSATQNPSNLLASIVDNRVEGKSGADLDDVGPHGATGDTQADENDRLWEDFDWLASLRQSVLRGI